MQQKYRLYRRRNGRFYWQENNSKRQGTLRTSDKQEAKTLLHAMNESNRQPLLNLSLARTYLAAHDPKMVMRAWRKVMTEMATHGIPSTQERCSRAFCSKAYDPLRHKPLVQTTADDLLAVLHANGNCVSHYLRRLQNLAVDLGWLAVSAAAIALHQMFTKESKESSPKRRRQLKQQLNEQIDGFDNEPIEINALPGDPATQA